MYIDILGNIVLYYHSHHRVESDSGIVGRPAVSAQVLEPVVVQRSLEAKFECQS